MKTIKSFYYIDENGNKVVNNLEDMGREPIVIPECIDSVLGSSDNSEVSVDQLKSVIIALADESKEWPNDIKEASTNPD